ncbi:MAG: serpin family protein [Candidatus Aminicenantia bacterium]
MRNKVLSFIYFSIFFSFIGFLHSENLIQKKAGFNKDFVEIVSSNNLFCLDLYSNIGKKGNIIFSPMSILSSFSIVFEGAKDKTAEEIRGVFRFPVNLKVWREKFLLLYKMLEAEDSKCTLKIANALWVQKDYKILPDYLERVEKFYMGKASNVDFIRETEKARELINRWVEERTNRKILNLLPPRSLDVDSRLVITNAIYFKGFWLFQFDKERTRDGDFKVNKEKIVRVPMMTLEGKEFNYAENEELEVIELPYLGEKISMLIILPKDGDIYSFEEKLTIEKINNLRKSLKKIRIDVLLPKFKLNKKYDLKEKLKRMGMPLSFSNLADFSGIDGTKNLFIQFAIHQAFVEVTEEGTEAGGATGISVGIKAMREVKRFRADHPFIFIIQERETGLILFFGRFCNPVDF